MNNREFNFRVWDPANRQMMPLGVLDLVVGVISTSSYDTLDGREKNGDVIQNYVIQQATGIKDKHGKSIYEGDLLKVIKVSGVCEVQYIGSSFGFWNPPVGDYAAFEPLDDWADADGYEIIGNAFENPEIIQRTCNETTIMKESTQEQIEYWADHLAAPCESIQMAERLVELEEIKFNDNGQPYWDATGEPLLETYCD